VPVLATPPAAALLLKDMDARPLTDIASVVQTAISGMIVVKMPTALLVYQLILIIYPVMKCIMFNHACTEPRTCADVGITQCCTDPSGTGH
jgi:hypothetical protein